MDPPNSEINKLYNPARQRDLEQFGRKIGYLASAGVAVLFSVVFWFVAELWWLSLLLLFGVFAMMAGTTWIVTRNPTPTVTCLTCGGRGWIDDLVEDSGKCPMCSGSSFKYHRYRGKSVPISIAEISGSELVTRRQKIGLPWI